MKLRQVKRCNLCGSTKKDWQLIFQLNAKQDLMRCNRCGLTFNNFQRIDFDKIYPDEYYEADSNVRSGGGWSNYAALEKPIQKLYRFEAEFIQENSRNKKSKLLDVGCSYGFFLKQFVNSKNIIPIGLELNKRASLEARKQGIKVINKPVEQLGKEKYDYITMFEVIEHVLDPDAVMKILHNALKADGYLIIATPDIKSLSFKMLKSRWSGIHDDVHNTYFDSETIKAIAERNGFRVANIYRKRMLWYDVFHIRKRIAESFPSFKGLLSLLRFADKAIIPFHNGTDLRVILRRLK